MAETSVESPENTTKIARDLGALTSCDLTVAWSLLKENVEKQIGKKNFACIPYITEGHLYDVTSLFVKIDQAGGAWRRVRTYRPLGLLESLLVKENSWEVWHNISENILVKDQPEGNIKIVLEDTLRKATVTATFSDLGTKTVPKDFSPIGQVMLDQAAKPELVKAKKVYFINEVILAKGIRVSISVGERDRIFVYRTPQPIAFRYSKFALDSRKMIVQRIAVPRVSSLRTTWIKLNVKEEVLAKGGAQSGIEEQESVESVETEDGTTLSMDTTADITTESSEQPIVHVSSSEQKHLYEMEKENIVPAN